MKIYSDVSMTKLVVKFHRNKTRKKKIFSLNLKRISFSYISIYFFAINS